MFRAVPMMKLRALVLERDDHRVLKSLGESGAVQLTRSQAGEETAPLPPRDRAGELARCARMRARIETIRQWLGGVGPWPKEGLSAEYTLDEAEERLDSIEKAVAGPAERRQYLSAQREELVDLCARARDYRGLDIPLNDETTSSFTHFVTGTLPPHGLEELKRAVDRNTVLMPLGQRKGRQSLVAVTTRLNRPSLESAMERAGFRHDVLDARRGLTVDILCEEGERELRHIEAEIEEVDKELAGYASHFGPLLGALEGFAQVESRLLDAVQKCLRTEAVILVTGWIPAHMAAGLEERLQKATAGRYALEVIPPDRTEEVPILLHHSRLLRPFEVLVSTYGLPLYRELEPTLFVAVSYLLMFGVMFGDAGHGLVLSLCGLLVAIRATGKGRDFGLLLLFAGLSSMIFGVIYGSYFGLAHFKKYALWHDPLEGDPIRLMYATIGFGVVMISLGVLLNVVNRLRHGDLIGGILDKFGLAGLLFYWGALVLLTNGSFFTSRGVMGIATVVLLGVPMAGWVVKEPLEHVLTNRSDGHAEEQDGALALIMESFVGAFEAILSYLANTISFVRLAAYAMSHAALLVAAFMVAAQVSGSSEGGGLWSVIIVIFGNIVAIVLEGIIASVQALRLEYYEFFGKFFSGKGQPFEPFRLAEGGEA